MLIDFTSKDPKVRAYSDAVAARFGYKLQVLVNGREIKGPYYVNTDVTPHVVKHYAEWPKNANSRTVRGNVCFAAPTKMLPRSFAV